MNEDEMNETNETNRTNGTYETNGINVWKFSLLFQSTVQKKHVIVHI